MGFFMILYPPEIQNLLRSIYSEEGRTYHGLNHIKYLLTKGREYFSHQPNVVMWNLLQHAIWWHDSWYSIFERPGRNEIESAALFSELHTQGKFTLDIPDMSEDEAAGHVYVAILTTARHLEDIDFNDNSWRHDSVTRQLAMLMMDVDLVGFAEEFSMVNHHSELVIKEYTPLGKSRESLLEGRIAFLKKLLERKRIFYTTYFHDKYEQLARINIQESIDVTQEELELIRKPVKVVHFDEPHVKPPYSDESKRFMNHAGLCGWISPTSYDKHLWRLDFDDRSIWHVSEIDNLIIKE